MNATKRNINKQTPTMHSSQCAYDGTTTLKWGHSCTVLSVRQEPDKVATFCKNAYRIKYHSLAVQKAIEAKLFQQAYINYVQVLSFSVHIMHSLSFPIPAPSSSLDPTRNIIFVFWIHRHQYHQRHQAQVYIFIYLWHRAKCKHTVVDVLHALCIITL